MYLNLNLEQKIFSVDSNVYNFNIHRFSDLLKLNFYEEIDCYKLDNVSYLSDTVNVLITKTTPNVIYILFHTPDFFDYSVKNAKVFKRFIKKFNIDNDSINLLHNMKVEIINNKIIWKKILFSYDPKQGDVSMEIHI